MVTDPLQADPSTWTAFDWAGVASMLAVAGGAVKWLFGLANGREAALSKREQDYQARVDAQINELGNRLARVERAYGVVVGVVHVWLDEIPHDSPSLPNIVAQLRMAFPVSEDMPAELVNLIVRLDGKQNRKRGTQ